MSAAIAVAGLDVTYRPFGAVARPALQDVSFEVPAGSTFGLVGANGAGKTTLLRTVAGLIAPGRGEVRVLGLEPSRQRTRLMQRAGVLLSGRRHFPERWLLTDVLTSTALLYGVRRPAPQVQQVAEQFGLADKLGLQVAALSLGNRQRLSLAATFVHDPEMALLDEPTLALDTESTERFLAYLKAREQQGKTTLITSHDHALLGRLVGGVVLLDRGRVMPQFSCDSEQIYVRLQVARCPAAALPPGVSWQGGQLRLPLHPGLLARVCSLLDQEGIELSGLRQGRGFEDLVMVPLSAGEGQDARHRVA